VTSNNPFNTESTWFRHMIIKSILGVVILGGTAWGAYLNSKVTQMDMFKLEVADRLARIEQKLDDIAGAVNAKRR